jgi:hypothetical protein
MGHNALTRIIRHARAPGLVARRSPPRGGGRLLGPARTADQPQLSRMRPRQQAAAVRAVVGHRRGRGGTRAKLGELRGPSQPTRPATAVPSPAVIAPARTVVTTGLSKNLAVGTGAALARHLLDRYGAGTLPASAFGEDEQVLRMATGLLYGDSDAQQGQA